MIEKIIIGYYQYRIVECEQAKSGTKRRLQLAPKASSGF